MRHQVTCGPDTQRTTIQCGWRLRPRGEWWERILEKVRTWWRRTLWAKFCSLCVTIVSKQLLKHGSNVLRFVWGQDYFGSNIEDTLKAKIQERKLRQCSSRYDCRNGEKIDSRDIYG